MSTLVDEARKSNTMREKYPSAYVGRDPLIARMADRIEALEAECDTLKAELEIQKNMVAEQVKRTEIGQ